MQNLLIGLGVMKAATTWLADNLLRSDEVFVPPIKEIHYFHAAARWTDNSNWRQSAYRVGHFLTDPRAATGHFTGQGYRRNEVQRFLKTVASTGTSTKPDKAHGRLQMVGKNADWFARYLDNPVNDQWYRNLFPQDRPNLWCLDVSNTTALLRSHDMRRAASMAPNTKAVMILRNPYDRLWSHVRFNFERSDGADALANLTAKGFARYVKRHGLVRHSQYGATLERAVDAFGPDRVLVLNFDEIKATPVKALKRVERFLDIGAVPKPVKARHVINKGAISADIPMDHLAPYSDLFRKDLAKVQAMGHGFVRPWMDGPTEQKPGV